MGRVTKEPRGILETVNIKIGGGSIFGGDR